MNPLLLVSLTATLSFGLVLSQMPGSDGSQVLLDDVVEPGQVQWHVDLEVAKAAAAKSGKPILVFQLLGQLDELHC